MAFPRILDIYGLMQSSGAVKSFFVCCGHATPVDLKRSSLATDKGFVLGLEFSVVALGRAAAAERIVEFRSKGKAIDDKKEPPIVAHALGDTKLRVRPVDGINELSAIIGSRAVSSLRALLLRSELLRVLVKDVELVEGRNLLSLLNKYPEGVGRAPKGKLGEALLMQALETTVKGLEAARTEQARTYTTDKQTRGLLTFTNTVRELVQLAGKQPKLLHLSSPFNEAAQQKLLAKLMKMEPKLGVTAPPPASNKQEGGGRSSTKRSAADVASKNSPAGSKSAAVAGEARGDMLPPKPIPNARLAALRASDDASSTASGSPPTMVNLTPLGQGQLESNSVQLAELTGKLQKAELDIAQVRAELAEERRTTARLQGEVSDAHIRIGNVNTLNETIAGLRAEVKTKDGALNDLRHSQALWSSMHMAKTEISPEIFERLIRAQTQGSSSSEP